MNIYMAAPLFTELQRQTTRLLMELMENHGHVIYDPVNRSAPIWLGRKPSECSRPDREAVLEENCVCIRRSDLVVAWLRGTGGPFTDQGVVWELGYARALGIPTLGWADPGELKGDFNVMIEAGLDGFCYEHELPKVVDKYAVMLRWWRDSPNSIDPQVWLALQHPPGVLAPEGSS